MPFGFGGKTADDAVWISTARAHAKSVADISALLGQASDAIANDEVSGWREVDHILNQLSQIEADCKEIQRSFKTIGKPNKQSVWRAGDDTYRQFMDAVVFAVHWGKHHYKDQTGGAGDRALTETGFAQKAALKRIRNNGGKFAANAAKASLLGEFFVSTVEGNL